MKITTEFVEQIRRDRSLQLTITNLARVAVAVSELQITVDEIKSHLGLNKTDESAKQKEAAAV